MTPCPSVLSPDGQHDYRDAIGVARKYCHWCGEPQEDEMSESARPVLSDDLDYRTILGHLVQCRMRDCAACVADGRTLIEFIDRLVAAALPPEPSAPRDIEAEAVELFRQMEIVMYGQSDNTWERGRLNALMDVFRAALRKAEPSAPAAPPPQKNDEDLGSRTPVHDDSGTASAAGVPLGAVENRAIAFPRLFVKRGGFQDDTRFIRCDDSRRSVLVLKNGREVETQAYELERCLEHVKSGSWIELSPAAPPQEQREPFEATFRKGLWVNHGCPFAALYGDDGEMQCGSCRIDFKREPLAELCETLTVMGRLHAGLLPSPAAPVTPPEEPHEKK